MKKLVSLEIILIIFFILIFIFLSYISPLKSLNHHLEKNVGSPASILYFNPSTIYSTCNGEFYSVPIFLSTGNNSVSGVQLELSFNSEFIHDVIIKPSDSGTFEPDSYSVSLLEIRENLGRASLALEINSNKKELFGKGEIAVFSFQTTSLTNQILNVTFIDKSTVHGAGSDQSLLKSSTPLTIYCSKTNLPNSQQIPAPGS